MNRLWILIFGVVLVGCQTSIGEPQIKNEVSVTPKVNNPEQTDWIRYSSPRFGYSFFYPPEWHSSFYDENDLQVLQGTHTITNYDTEKVAQYQTKGVVNWTELMNGLPPLKIDISVVPLENDNYEATVTKYTEMAREISASSVSRIGLEETRVFEMKEIEGGVFDRVVMHMTKLDNSVLMISRYGIEESDEEIEGSVEYDKFLGFLASFQFESE